MKLDDLPLFAWRPPRKVILFPLSSRAGKVRDVARKLSRQKTDKAATHYRKQVTDALIANLDRTGTPEAEQDEQLGAFWSAVEAEMARQFFAHANDGGTVA